MAEEQVAARFAALEHREPPTDYNYEHFTRRVVWLDGRKTVEGFGIRPGDRAPDFALPDTGGSVVRLSAFRGRPVLLHFGSFT